MFKLTPVGAAYQGVRQGKVDMDFPGIEKTAIDDLFDQYDIENKVTLDGLPEYVRLVAAVVTFQGIFGNGGYEYLFGNDFDDPKAYDYIIDGLEVIGLSKIAENIRSALSIFPNGKLHKSLDVRCKFIDKYFASENSSAFIKSNENYIFDSLDKIDEKLIEFIENNRLTKGST